LNKEPNRQFAVSASIAWCENIKKEAIFVDTAAYLLRSSYTCRRKLEMSS
jgi:hypothetical protein